MGYDDISIVQYESIAKVMEMDIDDIAKGIKLVSIVYGIPEDDVFKLESGVLDKYVNGLSFLNTPLVVDVHRSFKFNKKITVNDLKSMSSISSILTVVTGRSDYNAVDGMSVLYSFMNSMLSRVRRLTVWVMIGMAFTPWYYKYYGDMFRSYRYLRSIRLWQK